MQPPHDKQEPMKEISDHDQKISMMSADMKAFESSSPSSQESESNDDCHTEQIKTQVRSEADSLESEPK